MNNSFEERRKNIRIYRNFILSYHEKGGSTASYNVTQVNDVSKGGLNFSSTHPLKLGVILKTELKTPLIADPIYLEGTVLECREKIPELLYVIRLQFQDVPKKVLTALEKIESYGRLKEG